ncbi:hypothetical protein CBM2589_A90437 [Cupriavidus taiwanensis]|uniref:Uncharacterized protein n=1 Tax=Cupriavidus taiwanensis TaxID=164546 RepID=A0A975XG63_9BURK|nr:hypothetical protein CBM2589_A90437 [Cupriavidus taiwanensis]
MGRPSGRRPPHVAFVSKESAKALAPPDR